MAYEHYSLTARPEAGDEAISSDLAAADAGPGA